MVTEPWDAIEPWDAPIRSAAEALELVRRLEVRHRERWRRLLARVERDIAEDARHR